MKEKNKKVAEKSAKYFKKQMKKPKMTRLAAEKAKNEQESNRITQRKINPVEEKSEESVETSTQTEETPDEEEKTEES